MGWAFFCFLSIAIKAHLIYRIGFFSYIPEPIMKGTLPAIVMSGVLTTFIFQHFRQKKNVILFTVTILCYVVILLGAFYITRKYWGLSKLGATPAWLFLSSALTLMIFSFIYLLTDVAGRQNWFKMISPAGTDTLLCYLMPFFIGFILKRVLDLKLPEFLMAGALGLLKSFLLALLCVWVTHILIKFKIRLKL
jgi:predicted acyltransferase